MLNILPVEITLQVLSYLPLETLRILQLVSRGWRTFIQNNECTVYRHAALLHGFLPSSSVTSISELPTIFSDRSVAGVGNWKDFCHRRRDIDRSWTGCGPSSIKKYTAAGNAVHRIKVDEDAGYIITTSKHGGLTVTDLISNVILWSLPESYVRPYAHCEYGAGFIIFDRWGSFKEVWRRATDYDSEDQPQVSVPDTFQLQAFTIAEILAGTEQRGHFKPWALLRMPTLTRAFRFVYPTLLVAGENEVYLWDIPSATLIQTISGTQPTGGLPMDIDYVELSHRHVFICMEDILRIFSRDHGRAVYDIEIPLTLGLTCADWQFSWNSREERFPDAVLHPCSFEPQHEVGHVCRPPPQDPEKFVAVHVSACGSHLVALTLRSRLIVLYNFERALRGEAEIWETWIDIQLGPKFYTSRYLAFENDTIAVATGFGLFILTVQASPDPLETAVNLPPYIEIVPSINPGRIRVSLAKCFGNHPWLRSISCLQMTDTEVFFNWDPNDLLAVESMEYFHQLIEDGVAEDDDLTAHDIIDVDTIQAPSTVVCIDMLPSRDLSSR